MAIGRLTQVFRKGMISAPEPGAVTTSTSCREGSTMETLVKGDREPDGEWLHPEDGQACLPWCHAGWCS